MRMKNIYHSAGATKDFFYANINKQHSRIHYGFNRLALIFRQCKGLCKLWMYIE